MQEVLDKYPFRYLDADSIGITTTEKLDSILKEGIVVITHNPFLVSREQPSIAELPNDEQEKKNWSVKHYNLLQLYNHNDVLI